MTVCTHALAPDREIDKILVPSRSSEILVTTSLVMNSSAKSTQWRCLISEKAGFAFESIQVAQRRQMEKDYVQYNEVFVEPTLDLKPGKTSPMEQ